MMTAPRVGERVSHLGQGRGPHLGVADDPLAPAGLGPPASNCGFTSRTRSPPGATRRQQGASTVRSEMNDRSADDQVDRAADLVEVEGPDVGALPDDRPAGRPRSRSGGAGRGRRRRPRPSAAPRWRRQSVNPPVEAPASRARRPATSTPNRVEGGVELLAAAAHEAGRAPSSSTGSPGVDQASRLGRRGAADGHPPGRDQLLGLLAGVDQAPADQSASSRRRAVSYLAAGFLAAGFGRRLLGGGLLGRRLLGRRLGLLLDRGDPLGQRVEVGLGGGLRPWPAGPSTSVRMRSLAPALLAGAVDQVLDGRLGLLGPDLAGLDEVVDDLLGLLPGHLGVGSPASRYFTYDIDGSHGRNASGATRAISARRATASAKPSSTSHVARATSRGARPRR